MDASDPLALRQSRHEILGNQGADSQKNVPTVALYDQALKIGSGKLAARLRTLCRKSQVLLLQVERISWSSDDYKQAFYVAPSQTARKGVTFDDTPFELFTFVTEKGPEMDLKYWGTFCRTGHALPSFSEREYRRLSVDALTDLNREIGEIEDGKERAQVIRNGLRPGGNLPQCVGIRYFTSDRDLRRRLETYGLRSAIVKGPNMRVDAAGEASAKKRKRAATQPASSSSSAIPMQINYLREQMTGLSVSEDDETAATTAPARAESSRRLAKKPRRLLSWSESDDDDNTEPVKVVSHPRAPQSPTPEHVSGVSRERRREVLTAATELDTESDIWTSLPPRPAVVASGRGDPSGSQAIPRHPGGAGPSAGRRALISVVIPRFQREEFIKGLSDVQPQPVLIHFPRVNFISSDSPYPTEGYFSSSFPLHLDKDWGRELSEGRITRQGQRFSLFSWKVTHYSVFVKYWGNFQLTEDAATRITPVLWTYVGSSADTQETLRTLEDALGSNHTENDLSLNQHSDPDPIQNKQPPTAPQRNKYHKRKSFHDFNWNEGESRLNSESKRKGKSTGTIILIERAGSQDKGSAIACRRVRMRRIHLAVLLTIFDVS